MSSAEPSRTCAYSPDIGWRVVWQRIGVGLKYKEIAARLGIGMSTAHRLYMRFVKTGDVAKTKQPERPDSRKIDYHHDRVIHHSSYTREPSYIRECDSTLYVGLTRKQNGRPID